MSSESCRSNPPLQTALPINFIIIGGGIAGLACAIALRRVGHHAIVLERKERANVSSHSGIRLPPNCTKILYHWGLRGILMQRAMITHTLLFSRYESGEFLGTHIWDEGMLKETRGQFMLTTHAELHEVLYDAAVALGADIRYGAEVQEIDPGSPTVKLASGEVLSADVLVGADGEFGVSRALVLEGRDDGNPTGLALYDTTISQDELLERANFLYEDNGIIVAFGLGRAIVVYPIQDKKELAFQWYGPDEESVGRYGDTASADIHSVANAVHKDLRAVMSRVRKAVRVSIRDHEDLEDWVADDSRLVLIGEAAHPFPPGTIQASAMAIEDGAVLAKLFSHLSEERQIESFLYAFQELRQSRVRQVREQEFGGVFYMTLPDADAAAQRDNGLREKAAAGLNALDGSEEASKAWEEMEVIFGYDCEDQADDWWLKWGMLRERALSVDQGAAPSLLDFSKMITQVSSTIIDEESH
ncbi:hypothetical protein ONZ51_g9714 [Trametes cubensis]|uniref:FAD-binding domain-containing protein n=1 Tax=Trametes cubensis TaxID=1111947 RepID=A0AAD7TKW7_9APHY|nr:hypothetical protein ONZ51_g9714 [Trametes cubensis]